MNKLLILALAMLINVAATAQTDDNVLTKKEMKKKIEAAKDSINYAKTVQALNDNDFVVSADFLVLKRGRVVPVSPTTNFISLSGDKAVVQITPYNGGPGLNGIGGITLDGRASNIKKETDKKGNTYFSMSALGAGLSVFIELVLVKGSNRTSVVINQNTTSGKITLQGYLVPTEESEIFKGQPIF